MQLKSKHLWPVFDSFDLRHNDTDTDEEGNEFSISHTPDWVVAAMLEDLRALEAENADLEITKNMYYVRMADAEDVVKKQQQRIEDLEAENHQLRGECDMLFTRAAKRLAAIKELQAGGKCMCRCDACKYCEQLLEANDG